MENEFVLVGKRKLNLTKRQKEVIKLRNENYTAEEIGKILGIKASTVYQTTYNSKGRS